MKHWPNFLIIIVSAFLMQAHSIAFWLEYAGSTGVGFSLALEVVALWLWWQRCQWLAVIASGLLVGGALFQLSAPVIDNIYRNGSNQKIVAIYQDEIKQLTKSLSRYDKNSAERLGWSARIDRAQSELTQARKNLKQALIPQKKESPVQLGLILIMQALVLIIIMRSQIIAVTRLPFITVINKKPPVRITGRKNTQPIAVTDSIIDLDDFDKRVIDVAEKIENLLPQFDRKQKQIAEWMKVRPADISMALKHIERKGQKGQVISLPALQKMERAIEVMAA